MKEIIKIKTTKEIADGICSRTNPKHELIEKALIEFAKLHVKEVLLSNLDNSLTKIK